jgi:hypothetical protein
MMTPEEVQRTMDFILASHANSAIRMDRLERNMTRFEEEQKHQKETVDVLSRMTQDLLKGLQMLAVRTKRLETRSDSVDEMIKVLRELLENSLRRPEDPRQQNS